MYIVIDVRSKSSQIGGARTTSSINSVDIFRSKTQNRDGCVLWNGGWSLLLSTSSIIHRASKQPTTTNVELKSRIRRSPCLVVIVHCCRVPNSTTPKHAHDASSVTTFNHYLNYTPTGRKKCVSVWFQKSSL